MMYLNALKECGHMYNWPKDERHFIENCRDRMSAKEYGKTLDLQHNKHAQGKGKRCIEPDPSDSARTSCDSCGGT